MSIGVGAIHQNSASNEWSTGWGMNQRDITFFYKEGTQWKFYCRFSTNSGAEADIAPTLQAALALAASTPATPANVDCAYSWSAWSACSASTQTQTRTITVTTQASGSGTCPSSPDTQSCTPPAPAPAPVPASSATTARGSVTLSGVVVDTAAKENQICDGIVKSFQAVSGTCTFAQQQGGRRRRRLHSAAVQVTFELTYRDSTAAAAATVQIQTAATGGGGTTGAALVAELQSVDPASFANVKVDGIATAAATATTAASPSPSPSSSSPSSSSSSTAQDCKQSIIVIDVRTEAEWNAGHVSCAHRLPVQDDPALVDQVKALARLNPRYLSTPVVTYCFSGARAATAVGVLTSAGFTDVRNGGGYVQPPDNAAKLQALCDVKDCGGATTDGSAINEAIDKLSAGMRSAPCEWATQLVAGLLTASAVALFAPGGGDLR